MTLPAMRLAVARLLTQPSYQARFFAAPEDAAPEFGLTSDEFAALRGLDRARLAITCEGYSGKRLERVRSDFPTTLAALLDAAPGADLRFLASTPHPREDDDERRAFEAYVTHAEALAPPHRRFLLDLLDAERALLAAPPSGGLPAYRLAPTARPARTPRAIVTRLRGPLGEHAGRGLPDAYPEAPRDALVTRDARGLVVEDLPPAQAALLAACDGARTLEDLARAHGPEALDAVASWLRRGVVADRA